MTRKSNAPPGYVCRDFNLIVRFTDGRTYGPGYMRGCAGGRARDRCFEVGPIKMAWRRKLELDAGDDRSLHRMP